MTDTTRLNEIIEQSGLKKRFIAETMGLSPYGLSLKINNTNEFKTGEIERLCDILHIEDVNDRDAIFFANK